jgi:sulfate transport system substrate-binding protein
MIFLSGMIACQKNTANQAETKTVNLTLGVYTVPKEAYQQKIIPAFKEYWLKKTGQTVKFFESYIASGAQSRSIINGFEADIAALSLEKDVDRIKEAGLITHDWKNNAYKGMVSNSVVAIVVRPGNPKGIAAWEDLAKPGVQVLYPSPRTSGGAMWFVNAIYGAGLKIAADKPLAEQIEFAKNFLAQIQRNVKVMDKSGRESVTTFENGIGDVLVTYENEAMLRQKQGKDFPFILPKQTLLIQNPVALVDKNIEKHGNREVAEAFLAFLYTKESQEAFAEFGFRSVDPQVNEKFASSFAVPAELFDMDFLGGWEKIHQLLYAETGIWSTIIKEIYNE